MLLKEKNKNEEKKGLCYESMDFAPSLQRRKIN
jgi:hypothetical protein